VNPTNNSVSMFTIDPMNPSSPTLVGSAYSGGDWPLSVAANSNKVCAANSGVKNGIQCFTYSAITGLTPIANGFNSLGLTLTTPPVSHTGPAQISFTPDNKAIVVSIKGANPPVVLFDQLNNGTTISASLPILGMVPFGFTWDTDGTMVLTDAAPVGTFGGIQLVSVDTAKVNLTFLLGNYFLLTQNATCWITRSNTIGHFYGANAASSSVAEVSRSGNTLTLVNVYTINGAKPLDNTVVTVGNQDYLLQLSATQQIFVLKLTSGSATLIQNVTLASSYASGIATYTPAATTSSSNMGSTAMIITRSSASTVMVGLVVQFLILVALLI